ncbi:HSCB C-terminal oligomerization domain-containing protein [Neohortaea acidophila]|uniref:HSCB C-terminal oligomerization domain-containing protein n=1 Tax=Neohortaea acidophila TaxID=245834 RepID=A0A6A6PLL8_9PEZI|nr:HSCB C-terminal oligomerization domain-containing protein [Neohortaea acidophila]KAF2480591.1 HSCB C-terminal oligomerization domain-containing protein [Neohortaea acidophila]
MRRNTISSAKRAATTATRTSLAHSRPSPPFICAACRLTAASTASQRPFTTLPCRNQQPSPSPTTPTPNRESILPQTHYDHFPTTFPNGPPPNSPFTPNLRALRSEYLALQSKTHPDLAPQSQKRQAEARSMRLNEAYKTLQDPLRRARYLLSLRGIDVEDEAVQMGENELLMEVMEVREAVEEAESEEEVAALRGVNDGRVEASVGVLERAFARGDMEGAAVEAVRLRYWMNIEESIVGWEKGQGGGVIHH